MTTENKKIGLKKKISILEKIDIFFNNLKPNEKYVIILLPLGLVGFFVYYYLFPIINSAYQKSKNHVKNNISKVNNLKIQLNNINTNINNTKKNIVEYENLLEQIAEQYDRYYQLGTELQKINFKQNILIDILRNIIYQSLNYNIKILYIENITEKILNDNIKFKLQNITPKIKTVTYNRKQQKGKTEGQLTEKELLNINADNSKFLKTKAIIKMQVKTTNWTNFLYFLQSIENMKYIQKIKYMKLDKNKYMILLEIYGFNLDKYQNEAKEAVEKANKGNKHEKK